MILVVLISLVVIGLFVAFGRKLRDKKAQISADPTAKPQLEVEVSPVGKHLQITHITETRAEEDEVNVTSK